MGRTTRYVSLRQYAEGRAIVPDDFALRTGPVPEPPPGGVLVQTLVLSLDPTLRGSMTGRSDFYNQQFALDEPIHSRGVGRVIASRNDDFVEGDLVKGRFAWADYSVAGPLAGFGAGNGLTHARPADVKLSHHLGVLGNTGYTAFFGMMAVARPRPGDTVLISGAAGGVGSVAGQIARILGAKVYGLVGSERKSAVLTEELGFDGALVYRGQDLADRLRALIPGGPSIYFDNVGGELSQLVMDQMPFRGRVVECGQIATYGEPDGGLKVDIKPIHLRGLSFEGFAWTQYSEFFPAAKAQLQHWIATGSLRVLETERHGLESLPEAFVGMMAGENIGKMTVTVAE
ncbi:NADP-dependent oxidoreductase [Streptosporangium sp. NPDC002544]|uniref:NADP-dependent oxidoreductase n=1 Tax=Streptosporangium sp. NPDC002544 TaxID=3154538 RepID=UPI003318BDC1